jgi:ferredoxin
MDISLLRKTAADFISNKVEPTQEPSMGSGFSRRHFLGGAVTGIAIASIAQYTSKPNNLSSRIIRPPGALPEEDFNTVCIRCGECMKVCSTASLQPVFLEMGLAGLMTPHFSLDKGYCFSKCSMCQRICPVGAIQPFGSQDKPHIKIGEAEIIREKCICWSTDRNCRACEKNCPYNAVYRREEGGRLRPFVNPDVCTGCRLCEVKCPVTDGSAIVVTNRKEKRFRLKPGEKWEELNLNSKNST